LNEPVSRLIERVGSGGYTLILGSNTNQIHAAYFRRRFAATLDRFDAYVLSYEVGCLKPDRRFYEACVKAAGTRAGSCVFIDDMAENVAGARGAGLQSLLYVETAGLVAGLRELGVEVASDEG
jgi:FMN phosphatase YigB (HAD superfamily)